MYVSPVDNWVPVGGPMAGPTAGPMACQADALAGGVDPFALSGILAAMLDEIDYGLVVLDHEATILLANQLARDELARGTWIGETGNRLSGCGQGGAALDGQALNQAVRGRRSLISLGSRADTLNLSFVPLLSQGGAAVRHPMSPATLVAFGKRTVCELLTLRMYGDLHGLSGAENQLLPAISCGLSADAIARQQHVAVSTVRSQLHSIRTKTGVNSVRALMARLMKLPPVRPALKNAAP